MTEIESFYQGSEQDRPDAPDGCVWVEVTAHEDVERSWVLGLIQPRGYTRGDARTGDSHPPSAGK